jgi:hypothetical protein
MSHNKNNQKGAFNEGILILLGLCIVIFVFLLPARNLGPAPSFSSFNGSFSSGFSGTSNNLQTNDSSRTLQLGIGNASYAFEPGTEYITFRNSGKSSVNITGWTLQNAKSNRTYQVGSNDVRFQNDSARIPQGARFIAPNGSNALQNIILKPDEEAIITTGSVGVTSPYRIVSFKENMCTGYIESHDDYDFSPPLSNNCPDLRQEPGFTNLDRSCQDFIGSLPNCHTPEYDGLDSNRERCNGCIDGKIGLSNSCVAFIKSHAGYGACIANHQGDKDFEGRTWRIFLNRGWEMWARDQDSVSIFDQSGNLVTNYIY